MHKCNLPSFLKLAVGCALASIWQKIWKEPDTNVDRHSVRPCSSPPECEELRADVRAFVREEIAAGTFNPNTTPMGNGLSREFARKVGEKGWIGMTWPKQYGGQERSFLERYVVTEEFRAVAAPTRVFFTADRQSGPTIIRYGNDKMKAEILPASSKAIACSVSA